MLQALVLVFGHQWQQRWSKASLENGVGEHVQRGPLDRVAGQVGSLLVLFEPLEHLVR